VKSWDCTIWLEYDIFKNLVWKWYRQVG
jgi:hypothetical protein